MSTTDVISIRLDPDKVKQLDIIASQNDRSRNYILCKAVDDLLAWHAQENALIEQAIAEAERGETTPHEVVMAEMRGLLAKHSTQK